jgi:hypothetical protein
MSGEHSIKTLLMWLGGTVVAALIVFYVAGYAIDRWIALHDPDGTAEGGREPDQEPKLAR